MSSNVALELKNIGNTNICSHHIYRSKILKFQDTKVFSQIRRMKEFATFEFECVQNSKDKRIQNIRIRVCSKIKRMKKFKTCDLFSYYRFKMESGKLKSYTLAFKRRVLIRLEENDNNISKTAKEFNIHRKNLQRYFQSC